MRRLGVLGWPVAHSRSPAMHNAALAELGLSDWHYQALPVPPELFEQTTRALGGSGFAGANVTIPHKHAALALADGASEAARAIGAANTLTFAPGGAIAAENTDAPGLIAALDAPLAGKRALVLGAGGSARAAVWALGDAGAREVLICNRTRERAERLADELGASAVVAPQPADVLVNCTSVGLQAASDELEQLGLDAERLGDYALVVDLVYRVGATALVRAADEQGARTVDGIDVLVAQGALSLELWTGRAAPHATMEAAARG
ncbi:MAG TPA: shikimate dehydrogenase [Solirubrobacteraceae bacterium]|jgi:shikimate dehydrogenase|nr:shikimate dehydrogenase [Solirubrobacteraceae bacterium]